MDPFTFATIVGLLAAFESSRKGSKDMKEFKEWLSENNHSNVVTIIESNEGLQQELTSFMNQNHEQVMAQLSTLNNLMVSLASHMQGLSSFALRFDSNKGLSPQAIDVLRQFVKSDGVDMRHLQTWSYDEGQSNIYYLENSEVDYSEPRFIETDIDSLVNAGLITLTRGSKGSAIYKITRQAVAFIEAIDNKN